MKMECFKSSALTAAGYEAGELQVVFTTGAIWSYVGVPAEAWDRMMAAGSKGTFYMTEIKARYHGKQIKGPDVEKLRRPDIEASRRRSYANGVWPSVELVELFGKPELVEPDYLDEDA